MTTWQQFVSVVRETALLQMKDWGNRLEHLIEAVSTQPDPGTIVARESDGSIVANIIRGRTGQILFLVGADAPNASANGSDVWIVPGQAFTPGVTSPGLFVVTLGCGASSHGDQAGAIVYKDNKGNAVDSGFIGGSDLGGVSYWRFQTAPVGTDGRIRGVGQRYISGAELVLNAALASDGYVQVELPDPTVVGFRIIVGATIPFQVIKGKVAFNGATPQSQGNIGGSRANPEQALKNLLDYLNLRGDIVNNTTA